LNKVLNSKEESEKRIREDYEQRIKDVVNDYDAKIAKQNDEINELKSKLEKKKTKKNSYIEEINRIKKECKTLNEILETNIQDFEKRVEDVKTKYEKEIHGLRKREEDFFKTHADILDSDLYKVYKELKIKFEDKLKECLSYKHNNEHITGENRTFRINLDTSDDLLNECAKVQINQQKVIKQLQESLKQTEEILERVKHMLI
jgi:chromosome segregation ATPase